MSHILDQIGPNGVFPEDDPDGSKARKNLEAKGFSETPIDDSFTRRCQHGGLERKCDICKLERELAEADRHIAFDTTKVLQVELDIAERKLEISENNLVFANNRISELTRQLREMKAHLAEKDKRIKELEAELIRLSDLVGEEDYHLIAQILNGTKEVQE